jgi:hypothetical protein
MNAVESVRQWVETVVVGLNLCPFAKHELLNNRVRFCLSEAISQPQLLSDLRTELELLNKKESIETTLLIHPLVLEDFYEYNQFLNDAEFLVLELKLEGIYQIASFHPHYQFAGSEPDDIENYSNRSPYPMLHLIREKSLEQAIKNYPDTEKIPQQNIKTLSSIGLKGIKNLL